MERIPVLKVGDALLATIQVELHDQLVNRLKDDLTTAITESRVRGVIIDVSSVDVLDSYIARLLGEIASMSRLLSADAAIVGIQPAVAMTLVELGIDLAEIHTALDVDHGLQLLRGLSRGGGDGVPA